jgi:hypothetical protein
MYRHVGISASITASCILLENAIIGVAGIITFLAFLPFYSRLPEMGWRLWVPASFGFVTILLLFLRPQLITDKINWILRRLKKSELDESLKRNDVLFWLILYILPWVFAGLSLYFATEAFSTNIGLGVIDAIGISTLSMLVALLSMVLPSGLGLKEIAMGVLLSSWMPLSTAVVVAIAYRVVQTVDELVWALISRALFGEKRCNISK